MIKLLLAGILIAPTAASPAEFAQAMNSQVISGGQTLAARFRECKYEIINDRERSYLMILDADNIPLRAKKGDKVLAIAFVQPYGPAEYREKVATWITRSGQTVPFEQVARYISAHKPCPIDDF